MPKGARNPDMPNAICPRCNLNPGRKRSTMGSLCVPCAEDDVRKQAWHDNDPGVRDAMLHEDARDIYLELIEL